MKSNNIIKIFTIFFIITFIFDLNGVIPSSFIAIIIFITLIVFSKFINKKSYNPKSKKNFLYFKNQINFQVRSLKQNKIKRKFSSSLSKLNGLLVFYDSFQKLNDLNSRFESINKNSEINQLLINLQMQDFCYLKNSQINNIKQTSEISNVCNFNYLEDESSIWQI